VKKFWALFLLLIIFPLIFFALIGLAFRQTFYRPEFIKSELIKLNTYEKINQNIPELVNSFTEGQKDGGEPSEEGGAPFSTEETVALAQKILTPTELQTVTEAGIDGVWPWFFGTPEVPSEKTSTEAIKQKAEVEIIAAFKKKYESLPICRSSAQFSGDFFSSNSCRTKGVSFEELKAQYEAETGKSISFVSNLPDNFNVEGLMQTNPEYQNIYTNIKPFQPIFASGRYLVFLWPTILLLMVILLARMFSASWITTVGTAGIFLTICSFASFILGIQFFSYAQIMAAEATRKIPTSPLVISDLIDPLRLELINKTQASFNQITLGLAVVGILTFIIYHVVKFIIDHQNKKSGWSLKK